MCVCVRARMRVCARACARVCVHVHVHVHVYAHVYMYNFVCMRVSEMVPADCYTTHLYPLVDGLKYTHFIAHA